MAALTDIELAEVTADVAQQLRTTHIDRESWRLGLRWYLDAHRFAQRVGAEHGIAPRQVGWALAALSPMNRWDSNKSDLVDMILTGDCGALPLGRERAAAILHDGLDGDDVVGGRKVRSFASNINDPMTSLDVTIDTWMLNFLGMSINFLARKGVYDAVADGFRIVADELACLPHQLQAAIWIAERGDHE